MKGYWERLADYLHGPMQKGTLYDFFSLMALSSHTPFSLSLLARACASAYDRQG